MRALVIWLGVVNLVLALLVPGVGKSNYAGTVFGIITTYEQSDDATAPPGFSEEGRQLFRSIEQRSANSAYSLMAIFGCQGIILIAIGARLKKPLEQNTQRDCSTP